MMKLDEILLRAQINLLQEVCDDLREAITNQTVPTFKCLGLVATVQGVLTGYLKSDMQ